MTNQEVLNMKVEELLSNDDLLISMVDAASPDELAKIFAENNIVLEDVSMEDAFREFQKAKSGELEEAQLDNVAGGVDVAIAVGSFSLLLSGSAGAILCVAGGATLIALAGYAGYKYINKKFR